MLHGLLGGGEYPKDVRAVNKRLRELGIDVAAVAERGYYHWKRASTGEFLADAQSVLVYRASDLSMDRWISAARDAAKVEL